MSLLWFWAMLSVKSLSSCWLNNVYSASQHQMFNFTSPRTWICAASRLLRWTNVTLKNHEKQPTTCSKQWSARVQILTFWSNWSKISGRLLSWNSNSQLTITRAPLANGADHCLGLQALETSALFAIWTLWFNSSTMCLLSDTAYLLLMTLCRQTWYKQPVVELSMTTICISGCDFLAS